MIRKGDGDLKLILNGTEVKVNTDENLNDLLGVNRRRRILDAYMDKAMTAEEIIARLAKWQEEDERNRSYILVTVDDEQVRFATLGRSIFLSYGLADAMKQDETIKRSIENACKLAGKAYL